MTIPVPWEDSTFLSYNGVCFSVTLTELQHDYSRAVGGLYLFLPHDT
jgi:hypothetical protein